MQLTKEEITLLYKAVIGQNFSLPNAQVLLPLIVKLQLQINKWDEEAKKEVEPKVEIPKKK